MVIKTREATTSVELHCGRACRRGSLPEKEQNERDHLFFLSDCKQRVYLADRRIIRISFIHNP